MQSLRDFINCGLTNKKFAYESDFKTFVSNIESLHMFYVPSDLKPDFYVNQFTGDFKTVDIPFGNCWFEFIQPVEIEFTNARIYLLAFGVLEESPEEQILSYVFRRKSDGILGYYVQRLTDSSLQISESLIAYEKFSRLMYLASKITLESISNKNLNYVETDESVKERGRLGGVFTKVKYKPSDVVYVLPKKEFNKLPEAITKRTIQKPSYAYEVMGHWRKLQSPTSIGKDRQGQRGVRGYTWVSAHTRGEGELMKKTRIVV